MPRRANSGLTSCWNSWGTPGLTELNPTSASHRSGLPNVGLRFTNKPDGEGLCEISDTNWFQDHGRRCKHKELTCKYTWKSMLAEGWSSSVCRWPLCSTLNPGQWSCSTSRDGLFLFLLKNYRFVMKTTTKKRKTERTFKKKVFKKAFLKNGYRFFKVCCFVNDC